MITSEDAERRRQRRAFIRDNHPDRGGDPGVFIAGLASVALTHQPRSRNPPAPVVYRSRRPTRLLNRWLRTLTRTRRSGRRTLL